ncbi:PepSY domain-containing protein [Hyphomicrobium sp. ghe19]|uniref:PepSY domain-containing protein n=1 Tax=Hyphomicrobium sp. ghe19 TaxID=2682968 RepID=UPI001366DD06|nr:hypothetical protein HYPP_01543 [Hyphomicrobium sp. ghe19]
MTGEATNASSPVIKIGLRWLSILHRWVGVAACLLCVMWFTSGLVMMYVPYPAWTDADRVATLHPLDASRIAVTPGNAFETANVPSLPALFRLEMWGSEPVYRIAGITTSVAVSALDGKLINAVSVEDARSHLAEMFPGQAIRYEDTVDRDQWTTTSTFNIHRPLYLFVLDDGAGTEIYVSSHTGEIVQRTTRSTRFWNYLGSIPHWIYFTAIRSNGELWRQVVMWLSGPVIIVAVAGLWLGIVRLRVLQRYAHGRITPFRGWLKWHHLSGLIGGLFLTTWIATGWLSVGPFGLFSTLPPLFGNIPSYYADQPEPFRLTIAQLRGLLPAGAKDVSFSWLGNEPIAVVSDGKHRTVARGSDGAPLALGDNQIAHAAQRLLPESRIVLRERLEEEDVYWYSHRIVRQFPVLRVGFDDPGSTWVHLDPANGKILSIQDRSQRTYRWVFNLFHDFDLPILLHNRPLWDLIMWSLISAGLVISVTGTVIGWRVIRKQVSGQRPSG